MKVIRRQHVAMHTLESVYDYIWLLSQYHTKLNRLYVSLVLRQLRRYRGLDSWWNS